MYLLLKTGIWGSKDIKVQLYRANIMQILTLITCEATKEAVWLKKFLMELGVVPASLSPIPLYCDKVCRVHLYEVTHPNLDPQ